jgi:thiamine-monophosphate kinase
VIEAARLPLSPDARAVIERDPARIQAAYAGGDDYELLFTVPPAYMALLEAMPGITRIGQVEAGAPQAVLVDANGAPLALARGGYRHFGGLL